MTKQHINPANFIIKRRGDIYRVDFVDLEDEAYVSGTLECVLDGIKHYLEDMKGE